MPKKDEKILTYNPGENSLKASIIIYADLEYILKKGNLVRIILKILTQREELSINLHFTHGF